MKDRLGQKRSEEGFTLIELLIVIIILAILAAIVVFAVGTTSANALSATCSSDAKTFETALQAYDAEVGSYPLLGTGATGYDTTTATGMTQTFTVNGATVGPFLRQLPSTTHYQIVTDGAGGVFVYPAGALVNVGRTGMDGQTVQGVGGPAPTPPATSPSLNFDTDPGICSNPYVVQ
jgi:prepilin-type N-terminal cleavage/methylation domain-containing protein